MWRIFLIIGFLFLSCSKSTQKGKEKVPSLSHLEQGPVVFGTFNLKTERVESRLVNETFSIKGGNDCKSSHFESRFFDKLSFVFLKERSSKIQIYFRGDVWSLKEAKLYANEACVLDLHPQGLRFTFVHFMNSWIHHHIIQLESELGKMNLGLGPTALRPLGALPNEEEGNQVFHYLRQLIAALDRTFLKKYSDDLNNFEGLKYLNLIYEMETKLGQIRKLKKDGLFSEDFLQNHFISSLDFFNLKNYFSEDFFPFDGLLISGSHLIERELKSLNSKKSIINTLFHAYQNSLEGFYFFLRDFDTRVYTFSWPLRNIGWSLDYGGTQDLLKERMIRGISEQESFYSCQTENLIKFCQTEIPEMKAFFINSLKKDGEGYLTILFPNGCVKKSKEVFPLIDLNGNEDLIPIGEFDDFYRQPIEKTMNQICINI